MAVKDEDAVYPTNSLIAAVPRRFYKTGVVPMHWQLRSLLGTASPRKLYFPFGHENTHIQELDLATRKSETIAMLSFAPRSMIAREGWVCCGGEYGELVIIRAGEGSTLERSNWERLEGERRGALSTSRSRSRSQGDEEPNEARSPTADGGVEDDGGNEDEEGGEENGEENGEEESEESSDDEGGGDEGGGDEGNGDRSMDYEEYDDFDTRLEEAPLKLASVAPWLRAKSLKVGRERVNCITLWSPSTLVPPATGAYRGTGTVAVVCNNDKHVTMVDLNSLGTLDVVEFPDCVNRAVLSPDGRLLASVSDDPFLYIHERVERDSDLLAAATEAGKGSPARQSHTWKLLAAHHLRGQSKKDESMQRGSFAVCFSNTGQYLATGTQYGTITIFATARLNELGDAAVLACFRSSKPMVPPGAIREMAFCPGPYDLLAWSEDYGAVGVVDVRTQFTAQQVIDLRDRTGYESVDVQRVLDSDGEFIANPVDDSQLQQFRELRQQRWEVQGTNRTDSGLTSEIGVASQLLNPEYDLSSSEQAQRIRDALDRYHLPLTTDDTQMLDALQLRRMRERREQREQRERLEQRRRRVQLQNTESMSLTRPLSVSERTLHRLLESSGSGGGRGDNGSNSANDGSSADARQTGQRRLSWVSRQRLEPLGTSRGLRLGLGESSGNAGAGGDDSANNGDSADLWLPDQTHDTTVSGLLSSIRGLRTAQDQDWRGLLQTQNLIQAARQIARQRTQQAMPSVPAVPTVEDEESATDEEEVTAPFPRSSRPPPRAAQRELGGARLLPPGSFNTPGDGDRMLDMLHSYALDEPRHEWVRSVPRARVPANRPANRPAATRMVPAAAVAAAAAVDASSWNMGGIGTPRWTFGPEQKDEHTAGMTWSEDGRYLYVGTQGGVYEFPVNMPGRRFLPSITPR